MLQRVGEFIKEPGMKLGISGGILSLGGLVAEIHSKVDGEGLLFVALGGCMLMGGSIQIGKDILKEPCAIDAQSAGQTTDS